MNCPYLIESNKNTRLCRANQCPYQSKREMIALPICEANQEQKFIQIPQEEFLPGGLLIRTIA